MSDTPRRLSAAELDELDRLEREATPTPWFVAGGAPDICYHPGTGGWSRVAANRSYAQFVTKLRNAARLLIDEVRELRVIRDEWRYYRKLLDEMEPERDQLRAENARLRTDIDLMLKPSSRDGDIPAQARAWQATWTALDRAGIYSFWCDSMLGVDRATEFIDHLAAENARLRAELAAMKGGA